MSIWSNTRLLLSGDRQCRRWFMTVFAFTALLALMPATAQAQSQDELFAELRLDVFDIPTLFFVDYVHNFDADDYDTGYAAGASMSFENKNHPWKLGYTYQDLEADATFALFTDSDFIGGGTDGKGHIFRGSYSLTKAIALGGTLFVNKRGGNQGESEDFNRLMLDVSLKY